MLRKTSRRVLSTFRAGRRYDTLLSDGGITLGRPGKIESIEISRGVAATLVLLHHANGFSQIGDGSAFGGVFQFGSVGVDFFFVLSGFIILHVHRQDLGQPEQAARYAWRRFIRVCPLYIVLTLASLLLVALLPFYRTDVPHSANYLISNLLMLPHGSNYPLISPAWSLSHELVFYLVFAVAILNWKVGCALITAWMTALVFARLFLTIPDGLSGLRFTAFGWLDILFAFGLAAALVAARIRNAGGRIFAVGAFIFLGACVSHGIGASPMANDTIRRLVYGTGSALMIVGMVVWESGASLRFPRWAITWGAASYAIYLVHYPVLELLSHARIRLGLVGWIHDEPYFILQAVVGVCCGVLIHLKVEKPITAWLKSSPIHLRLEAGRPLAAAGNIKS
ncbi:MAG: acyltransferase family protein [Xanthobacteraceae bacterium]